MPTPQDDEFSGPALDPKWTFHQTVPGGTGSYSFLTNPGNLTLSVPADAALSSTLDSAISLREAQGSPLFYVEVGLTSSGIASDGQESGVFVAKSADPTTFVAFTKKMVGVTSELHAKLVVSGVLISESLVGFIDDTNIVLRITRYGGVFAFSYKRYEETAYTALGYTAADSFGTTSVGLVAHCSAGTPFSVLADYFHARSLADVAVDASTLLRIGNTKITDASTLLTVRNYPAPRNMRVYQHFESPINTIKWDDGVFVGPTLKSPGGVAWTIFVDNTGATGTAPGVVSAVGPIYLLDVVGKVWQLGVADDGALTILARPDIDTSDTALCMAISPDTSYHYITVSYADPFSLSGPALATFPTAVVPGSVIIVRKEGSSPKTAADGTVVFNGASTGSFDDGPIASRGRQFYSVFQVYNDKNSPPLQGATMPVFVNLYNNVGHRFSRKYQGGVWWMLYSISNVTQTLVDVDIAAALAQFNIHTATGSFLSLWGKLFGARKYPGETSQQFGDRVIARVLAGRTTPAVIKSEVSKIPGVVFCDIIDSSSGSMFVGHSFIGYTGTEIGDEATCFTSPIFYDNPFFFTVRVKIKAGTNLDQIIKTVQDNKAAGTRFAVEILETLP